MPPVKKKKRGKTKRLDEQEDTESSESGKLSETHEVAQHLSRTRLGGKENTPKKGRSFLERKDVIDPYDADSEPEAPVLTSMVTDENIPAEKQLSISHRVPLLHGDHSTPSVQATKEFCGSWYGFDDLASPLPFSPVGEPQMPQPSVINSPGSVSVTSSLTSISPGKRKNVFDVPIEKPSKKTKKKKPTKILDTEDEDWVTDMKSQFQEIEMVDLLVD